MTAPTRTTHTNLLSSEALSELDQMELGELIVVSEPYDAPLDNDTICLYVEPTPENEPEAWKRRNVASLYRVYAPSLTDAVDELTRLIHTKYLIFLCQRMRNALPHRACWHFDEMATAWLTASGQSMIIGSEPEKIAERAVDRDYYKGIRSAARDILQRVRDGELDEDDVEDAISEIDVIYYSDAYQTIYTSENRDAYEEFGGEMPEWCAIATMAQQEDVREIVHRELEEELERRREREEAEEAAAEEAAAEAEEDETEEALREEMRQEMRQEIEDEVSKEEAEEVMREEACQEIEDEISKEEAEEVLREEMRQEIAAEIAKDATEEVLREAMRQEMADEEGSPDGE